MSTRISRRDFAKAAAYASLGTAIAGSSVHAQALAKEGSVDWAMNATIIDGCSCQLLCPCIFVSPATVGSLSLTSDSAVSAQEIVTSASPLSAVANASHSGNSSAEATSRPE